MARSRTLFFFVVTRDARAARGFSLCMSTDLLLSIFFFPFSFFRSSKKVLAPPPSDRHHINRHLHPSTTRAGHHTRLQARPHRARHQVGRPPAHTEIIPLRGDQGEGTTCVQALGKAVQEGGERFRRVRDFSRQNEGPGRGGRGGGGEGREGGFLVVGAISSRVSRECGCDDGAIAADAFISERILWGARISQKSSICWLYLVCTPER